MQGDQNERELAWHLFENTGSPYAFLLYRDAAQTLEQPPAYRLPPFYQGGEEKLPGRETDARDKLKLS